MWLRDSRRKKYTYSTTGSYAGAWYADDLTTPRMISPSLRTIMDCHGLVSKRCASFPRKENRADSLSLEKAASLYMIVPATPSLPTIVECHAIVRNRRASFPRKEGRADSLSLEKAANLYTTEPATSAVVDIQDTVVDANCLKKKKIAICE